MQHLITVCGYIFITVFVVVTAIVIIAVINHNRRVKKAKKRMEEMNKIREARWEQEGAIFLAFVKEHLEYLDNQRISKN